MKCQNCGVNYDDNDRYCPMCGTKSRKTTRPKKSPYTTYKHQINSNSKSSQREPSDDINKKTAHKKQYYKNKNQPTLQNINTYKTQYPKKQSNIGCLALIVIMFFGPILTSIISFTREFSHNFSSEFQYATEEKIQEQSFVDSEDYYAQELDAFAGYWQSLGYPYSFEFTKDCHFIQTYNDEEYTGECVVAWCEPEGSEFYSDDAYSISEYDCYYFNMVYDDAGPNGESIQYYTVFRTKTADPELIFVGYNEVFEDIHFVKVN